MSQVSRSVRQLPRTCRACDGLMSYFAGAEDPLYRFFRRKRGERRVETNPDQTSSDGSKDRLTEKTGHSTVKRLDWCGHQNGSHQPQKCKFLNDWIVFTSETQHKSPVRHKFRLAQDLCDRFWWRHGLYDSAPALLGSRPNSEFQLAALALSAMPVPAVSSQSVETAGKMGLLFGRDAVFRNLRTVCSVLRISTERLPNSALGL